MSDLAELLRQIQEAVKEGSILSVPVAATLHAILQNAFYRPWKRVALKKEEIQALALKWKGRIFNWDRENEFAFNVCYSCSVPEGLEVQTVLLRPRDLNFMEAVSEKDLLKRAKEFYLGPCPMSIALPLREAFLEQLPGNSVTIISDHFSCMNKEKYGDVSHLPVSPGIFVLRYRENEDGPCLFIGSRGTYRPDSWIVLALTES
jgi:hypothetical protein